MCDSQNVRLTLIRQLAEVDGRLVRYLGGRHHAAHAVRHHPAGAGHRQGHGACIASGGGVGLAGGVLHGHIVLGQPGGRHHGDGAGAFTAAQPEVAGAVHGSLCGVVGIPGFHALVYLEAVLAAQFYGLHRSLLLVIHGQGAGILLLRSLCLGVPGADGRCGHRQSEQQSK